MKNFRGVFLVLLWLALVFSLSLSSMAEIESPSTTIPQNETELQVESILEDYMSLRENSVISLNEGQMTTESFSTMLHRLEGAVDQLLLQKEEARRRGHAVAAQNAGIVVVGSRIEVLNKSLDFDGGTIRVRLYERTVCDYRGLNKSETDPCDTFMFGIWHDMVFSQIAGQWVLVQDEYDDPNIVSDALPPLWLNARPGLACERLGRQGCPASR